MELTWRTLYNQAVHDFNGDTPGEDLEQRLLDHFATAPTAVKQAIDKLTRRYQDGKIRSPWPLILRELERDQTRDITATDNAEKALQTRLAETYIRNAGLYLPTETELIDDLFGPHGRLRAWTHDTQLQARMTTLWQDQQPRAQQAEHDVTERAEKWKATRRMLTEPRDEGDSAGATTEPASLVPGSASIPEPDSPPDDPPDLFAE